MDSDALTSLASTRLSAQADPGRAAAMAAYMKTEMPLYGVQAPDLRAITRELVTRFPASDWEDYDGAVRALWRRPHREEKHLAIRYARRFPRFINPRSIPLYRTMIVEGAWWDFVDTIAANLVGSVLVGDRSEVTPVVRTWIDDPDMWLRRSSIICQLGHKADTDTALLREACVANLADKEFFIRKAIGWSLREYAKTDPDWVRAFVVTHRDDMSALSIRESTKHL